MEILYSALYAFFIGFYNVFRKLSLKKSEESVTLVIFTTVAFVLSMFFIPLGIGIAWNFVLLFLIKGILLATSWFIILKVLKNANLSVVNVTRNVIAAILSFVVGITIFNETVGIWKVVGAVIIIFGVTLINLVDQTSKKSVKVLHFVLLIISSAITVSSSVIDKFAISSLESHQIIFWTYLFISLFSWVFFSIECLRKKEFLIKKQDLKNTFIYFIGLFLFTGDCMLFLAYKVPGSQLITISIVTKLQVVVTVLASVVVFKEKNILKKLLLTLLVIVGVVLMTI